MWVAWQQRRREQRGVSAATVSDPVMREEEDIADKWGRGISIKRRGRRTTRAGLLACFAGPREEARRADGPRVGGRVGRVEKQAKLGYGRPKSEKGRIKSFSIFLTHFKIQFKLKFKFFCKFQSNQSITNKICSSMYAHTCM